MTAVLGSFALSLLVEHYLNQHVDAVILAVVLSFTLVRRERSGHSLSLPPTAAVMMSAAAVASGIGQLMARNNHLGDALFVIAVGGSVWVRRFGSGWTSAGALTNLPFVAALVTPYPPQGAAERAAWSAGIGLLVVMWVAATQTVAHRIGFLPRSDRTVPTSGRQNNEAPAKRPGIRASTRMGLQMAVALALAFVIGRYAFPDHWTWPVLTAFIVCSGNRGRGDVLHKAGLRAGGAAAGTVVAAGLSGYFPPGDKASVAIIFVFLGVATWLRAASYGYWAACITASLALLYDYFGQGGAHVLEQRLLGILLGAVLGIGASWFVLPVRTTDVLRRRTADLLAALTELLVAVRDQPQHIGEQHAAKVIIAISSLHQIAGPLKARRSLGRCRRLARWPADVIDAAGTCATPARIIVRSAMQQPAILSDVHILQLNSVVLANVVAVRRSLGARSDPELRPLPDWMSAHSADTVGSAEPARAMVAVNGAVSAIADSVVIGFQIPRTT